MSKIFVTGASGFIGKRLIAELLDNGHEVFALYRIRGMKKKDSGTDKLHFLYGDFEDPEKMDLIPLDIDAAYYLVHSMAKKLDDLMKKEVEVAKSFVRLMDRTNCRQIIYLGGIIPRVCDLSREGSNPKGISVSHQDQLSVHLRSRKAVEEVLKQANAALTVLRSSIIIGSGSASFEIIRDLSEKLPVMVAPRWVNSLCQPIAIADVIFYLERVLLNPKTYEMTYDIGGTEVMSFKEVLLRYARFRGLRRYILNVPFLTPRLSSYWLVFVTSVRFSLCSYLVESMKSNSICTSDEILKTIPHTCISLEEAFKRAFRKIEKNEVPSTWMDAWLLDEKSPDISKFTKIPSEGCFIELKDALIQDSREAAIERIWSLGGDRGWFGLDWAWKLRGIIDQLFHGPGMNRGRRHPTDLELGDSIDFWRVVQVDKEKGHLILYAQMHLPGEAWLEFQVNKGRVYQLVAFQPKGLLGRLYWYAMMPFHFFIFTKMIRGLAGKLSSI